MKYYLFFILLTQIRACSAFSVVRAHNVQTRYQVKQMLEKTRFTHNFFFFLLVITSAAHANESSWGGTVEIEGGAQITKDETKSSDITLATAELAYEQFFNKNTSMYLRFLHEDDLSIGRQYLPFGSYNSALISDPLTLEIGETREAAIGFSKSFNLVTTGAYIFQGDVQTSENAWLPDLMARISIADEGNISYSVDAYFISELANSENMTAALSNVQVLSHTVGGAGFAVQLSTGPFTVDVECLTALKRYAVTDFNNNRPMACHFEANTGLTLASKESSLGVAYSMTNDARDLELPRSRLSAGASILFTDNLSLAAEWAMESDYLSNEDSSGKNTHMITAQLAMTF